MKNILILFVVLVFACSNNSDILNVKKEENSLDLKLEKIVKSSVESNCYFLYQEFFAVTEYSYSYDTDSIYVVISQKWWYSDLFLYITYSNGEKLFTYLGYDDSNRTFSLPKTRNYNVSNLIPFVIRKFY